MRKTILNAIYVIFIILTAAMLSFFVAGERVSATTLQVTLVSQIPDPVEPGQYVELRWKIENLGDATDNVIFELLPEYPFSLEPGVNASKNIGSLWGKQDGDKGVIVYYKIKVDENAIDGNNDIKVQYKAGNVIVKPDAYTIRVRTSIPILIVKQVSTDPGIVNPGGEAALKIKFENLALSTFKNIKSTIDFTGTSFSPIDGTNEKIITAIPSKKEVEVEYKIKADPSAESKVHKLTLKLEYLDNSGTALSKNNTIGIEVGATPDVSVEIESTDLLQKGSSGNIVLKFVNKGLINVKFLDVELRGDDKYEILSPSKMCIGKLDSDDYETTEFKIYVKSDAEGKITLPVFVEYKDANNNNYNKIYNVDVRVYSASEAEKLGLKTSSRMWSYIIIVIVMIAAILIYRKWGMKRQKQ